MKEFRQKIADYLESQFEKNKVQECMPESENGYEYIPKEAFLNIVDGLIPMFKKELKSKVSLTDKAETK